MSLYKYRETEREIGQGETETKRDSQATMCHIEGEVIKELTTGVMETRGEAKPMSGG